MAKKKKTSVTKLLELRENNKGVKFAEVRGKISDKEFYNLIFDSARAFNDRISNRSKGIKISPYTIAKQALDIKTWGDFDKLTKQLTKGYTIQKPPKETRLSYTDIFGFFEELVPERAYKDNKQLLTDFLKEYRAYNKLPAKKRLYNKNIDSYISELKNNFELIRRETERLRAINESKGELLDSETIMGKPIYKADFDLLVEAAKKHNENLEQQLRKALLQIPVVLENVQKSDESIDNWNNLSLRELMMQFNYRVRRGEITPEQRDEVTEPIKEYPETIRDIEKEIDFYNWKDIGRLVNVESRSLSSEDSKLNTWKSNYFIALKKLYGNDSRASEIVRILNRIVKEGNPEVVYKDEILDLDEWYKEDIDRVEERKNEIYNRFKELEVDLDRSKSKVNELEPNEERLKKIKGL